MYSDTDMYNINSMLYLCRAQVPVVANIVDFRRQTHKTTTKTNMCL